VPVLDLLTTPGNDTLLHDADCAGLVEFGTKGGWVWGTRAAAQWKPWPELVRELKAARDRALCVRLTAAGRKHVGRLRLGLVESKSPATPKPAAKPKAGAAKPKRRRNRAKRTEPTRRMMEAFKLHEAGSPCRAIGETLDVSPETARTWVAFVAKYIAAKRSVRTQALPTDRRGAVDV
jgi:hypothetical protein